MSDGKISGILNLILENQKAILSELKSLNRKVKRLKLRSAGAAAAALGTALISASCEERATNHE